MSGSLLVTPSYKQRLVRALRALIPNRIPPSATESHREPRTPEHPGPEHPEHLQDLRGRSSRRLGMYNTWMTQFHVAPVSRILLYTGPCSPFPPPTPQPSHAIYRDRALDRIEYTAATYSTSCVDVSVAAAADSITIGSGKWVCT